MSLLDCGGGPGTVTLGLAEVVTPGEVVGIDSSPSYVERARAVAAKRGLSNIRFEVGNIYELPFPDYSFDATFAHAVLNQLGDPSRALGEMHRVLKPGGLISLRTTYPAGDVHTPADPLADKSMEILNRLYRHNGGDWDVGRRLRGLLLEAGCRPVRVSDLSVIGHPGGDPGVGRTSRRWLHGTTGVRAIASARMGHPVRAGGDCRLLESVG